MGRSREVVAIFVAEVIAVRELHLKVDCSASVDILQTVHVDIDGEWCAEWMFAATKLYPIDLIQLLQDGERGVEYHLVAM